MLKEYELGGWYAPTLTFPSPVAPFHPIIFCSFSTITVKKSIRNINIMTIRLTCVFGWMEWLLNFTLKPSPLIESTLNRSVTEAGLVGWACLGNLRVKVISPSFSASQITKKLTTTRLMVSTGQTSKYNQSLAGNQIKKNVCTFCCMYTLEAISVLLHTLN